jgi:hypothetical protein
VIVAVPAERPVNAPEEIPIEPVTDGLLLHVPPPISVSVVAEFTQTLMPPEAGNGKGLTVTTVFLSQPVDSVYVIPAVPETMPATLPEPSTAAMLVAPLPHVPPVVASVSSVTEPAHTVFVPVIIDGNGLTVTISVAEQVVGKV